LNVTETQAHTSLKPKAKKNVSDRTCKEYVCIALFQCHQYCGPLRAGVSHTHTHTHIRTHTHTHTHAYTHKHTHKHTHTHTHTLTYTHTHTHAHTHTHKHTHNQGPSQQAPAFSRVFAQSMPRRCVCACMYVIYVYVFSYIVDDIRDQVTRPTLSIMPKYLRASPAHVPFGSWYLTGTKHIQLTIMVG